jgi:hypothetical protein
VSAERLILEDGPVYTPEQVSANGWLDASPGALRKAVARKQIECTRFQGRIYFTRANILAIQAAGFQPAKADERAYSTAPRRPRRTPTAETSQGVSVLRPRPEARRRRRAS